jgi:AraC-like DNA-binding protein
MATRVSSTPTITAQRMVDFIERSFADRLTLQTVSVAIRGEPAQLGRVFQSEVGVSVHEYVTRVRLDHAAHLISSRMKIEAVALSVGYRSKKNFYRQFARHFGVTPEAFRRRGIPKPNGHVNGAVGYAARFNGTSCLIAVHTRDSVTGAPSFIATPYVLLDHGLQPFEAPGHIEITGITEADALERAATFLELRFGIRVVAPKRASPTTPLPILAPRR